MQLIKRRFFAMRNGLVADTLRRGGSPFKIIFGLNIPQISEIADEFGKDAELARELWNNRTTRESMLIAPMMMHGDRLSIQDAETMVSEAPSPEITDSLCHKLLRLSPLSFDIARNLSEKTDDMSRYAAMRLLWHHIFDRTEEVSKLAEIEFARNCPLTRQPALQIINEIEFLSE